MRRAGYLLLIYVLVVSVAHAQVLSEISASPISKQWIEIYNNTSADIDLTQYKILDNGASVNGHSISAVSNDNMLPAGAYGVIAKDPTSVSATYIFKSSLGIKTTGDTVTLKTGSTVADTLALPDGSSSSGNTYQKSDTGWSLAASTPGAQNAVQTLTDSGSSNTNSTTTATATQLAPTPGPVSSHYSFVPLSDTISAKFSVNIGRDRLGYIGVPLVFKAVANTDDPNASYFWTLGDGTGEDGRDVVHTYLYAGTYTIVLNAELLDNHAVSRANVTIIRPEISVTYAGPEYAAVTNNSKYEINLFGWRLEWNKHVFVFPQDTIIGAGNTVNFSSLVTKLYPNTLAEVALLRDTEDLPAVAPVRDVPFDTEKQKQIDALTLQLSHAEKQLADLLAASSTEHADPAPQSSQTASAAAALPQEPSSWLATLKHFFRLK